MAWRRISARPLGEPGFELTSRQHAVIFCSLRSRLGRRKRPPGIGPPGGSHVSAPATNRPRPLALVVVGPLLGPERGPRNRRPGIGSLTCPYVGGATWT